MDPILVAMVLGFALGATVAIAGVVIVIDIAADLEDRNAEDRAVAMFGAAIESNIERGAHYEGDNFVRGEPVVVLDGKGEFTPWLDIPDDEPIVTDPLVLVREQLAIARR